MDLNTFLSNLFKKNTFLNKKMVFKKEVLKEMEKDFLFLISKNTKELNSSKEENQKNLLDKM